MALKSDEGQQNVPQSRCVPRIVLTYGGILVADDSPLLQDKEWLEKALEAKSDDQSSHDYGQPLLRLAIDPELTGQEAVDYIKQRPASETQDIGELRAAVQSDEMKKAVGLLHRWHSQGRISTGSESEMPPALMKETVEFLRMHRR